MNAVLQTFARQWLKDNVAKLPEKNQTFFKKMYVANPHKHNEVTVDQVVDKMAAGHLDWAMQQVINT